jgi:hypothetical protein
MRIFILLDNFTEKMQEEIEFYKNDQYISLWIEYADLCCDEINIYYFMFEKGIYFNKNYIIDKIINYYLVREEFKNAKNIYEQLSQNFKIEIKISFYTKLKATLESKICESMNFTIIFPEIISSYLKRQMKEEGMLNIKEVTNNKENSNNSPVIEFKNDSENIDTLKLEIDYLIKKFFYIKLFLIKYDENFKLLAEKKKKSYYNNDIKPYSWLKKDRFKPTVPTFIVTNILDYLHVTYYYTNVINSSQSSLVKYALKQTESLPKKCNLIFVSDPLQMDVFEYLFKGSLLVYSKYEKDCYLTKISILKFVNNNFHTRTVNINYAVKKLVYLHGINDYYIGIFTPFYFIIFDTKNLNFVSRYRYELNHFTEENATLYFPEYDPKLLAFSLSNIIYVVHIDTDRNSITIKHKLEGHKDEINKLSFKMANDLPILISSSKSQIIMWNLDGAHVLKLFSIDENKLLINQLILININVLCIMTMYNQMYVLEFSENTIKNIKVINFFDEEYIYKVDYEGNFVFRLNSNSLNLYDIETERNLISFDDEKIKTFDLIFVHNNSVIQRYNNKNRIAIFNLN